MVTVTSILIRCFPGISNPEVWLFGLLFFLGSPLLAQQPPYRLVDANGLWVEQFGATDSTENRYTANNRLYPEGSKASYRYYFMDHAGKKYLQKVVASSTQDREKAWRLVPLEARDSLTNDRLHLIIESDLEGVDSTIAGYNHTPIRWEYSSPAGPLHFLERLSLIENEKTLWLHPPHARLFRILALNPYPYIQAPWQVGHHWEGQQQIPPHWGDARWQEWKDPLMVYYRYSISHEETLVTPFGRLSCYVVTATAQSSLGTSRLLSYFHPDYGFLKLHYTNIDGSQLLMELVAKE